MSCELEEFKRLMNAAAQQASWLAEELESSEMKRSSMSTFNQNVAFISSFTETCTVSARSLEQGLEKLKTAQEEQEILSAQLDQRQTKVESAEQKLKASQATLSKNQESLARNRSSLLSETQALERRKEEFNAEILSKTLATVEDKLEGVRLSLDTSHKSLQDELAAKDVRIADLASRTDQERGRLEVASRECSSMTLKMNDMRLQQETTLKDLQAKTLEVTRVTKEHEGILEQLDKVKKDHEKLLKKKDDTISFLLSRSKEEAKETSRWKEAIRDTCKVHSKLVGEVSQLNSKLREQSYAKSVSEDRLEQRTNELEAKEAELENKNERIDELEAKLGMKKSEKAIMPWMQREMDRGESLANESDDDQDDDQDDDHHDDHHGDDQDDRDDNGEVGMTNPRKRGRLE